MYKYLNASVYNEQVSIKSIYLSRIFISSIYIRYLVLITEIQLIDITRKVHIRGRSYPEVVLEIVLR